MAPDKRTHTTRRGTQALLETHSGHGRGTHTCMGQKWWGYKQAAPRGSPELRGEVKQRQKGWAICRSLASRLSRSQQRAGRNPSMSRNRPLSLELGQTIAHITSNFPVKNPTPAASTCLPLKPGGGGEGGPALPAALITGVGSHPPSLTASVPRALQPLDSSAS